MTRIYLLTSFGGEYDDEWENVEAVFSSYAAMATWINGRFDEVYLSGSFKCSGYDEVMGLKYKAYDVIGEVDCKTDKIIFKENHND